MRLFALDCTEVGPHLYMGGASVARNLALLRSKGVTHVVNCAGDVCDNYHEKELEYLTWVLFDHSYEDIVSILYPSFDFIDAAIRRGGSVYVHCHRGVSRSAALVTAYLMFVERLDYDTALARVRERRGVARPNLSFQTQLEMWRRRLDGDFPRRQRVVAYRVAPHAPLFRDRLVPKWVDDAASCALDPRAVYIFQSTDAANVVLWVGAQCADTKRYVDFATQFVKNRLCRFEHASDAIEILEQGAPRLESRLHFGAAGAKDPEPREVRVVEGFDVDYNEQAAKHLEDRISNFHRMEQAETEQGDDDETAGRSNGGAVSDSEEESTADGGKGQSAAALYEYPKYDEPFSSFDSEDLMPNSVYLLVRRECESSGSGVEGKAGEPVHVHVWIGSEFVLPRGYESHKDFALAVVREFESTTGLQGGAQPFVELEDHESDEFFNAFPEG
jgi:hypothetical protein